MRAGNADVGHDAMETGVAASIPAAAVSKDAGGGKKKRANRSAKLKQCKLDVRREQWLNQVKGKDEYKDHGTVESPTSPNLPRRPNSKIESQLLSQDDESNDGSLNCCYGDGVPQVHNLVSPGNRRGNISPSGSLTSGSSLESSSRSDSDVEEEDNEVLDDWEAVVDAMLEDNNEHSNHDNELYPCHVDPALTIGSGAGRALDSSTVKTKPVPLQSASKAWQPNDAARPQSLPNISKQWIFPMSIDQRCRNFHQRGVLSSPSSCPICCEDLDLTDTSFLPCSCGFHLCLFCHKQILEADGRCPGCRKKYNSIAGSLLDDNTALMAMSPFPLSHSCSMSPRT